MAYSKITQADLFQKGVIGMADTPELSTQAMQEKFDEIAKNVIVPKFNALSDELTQRDLSLYTKSETDGQINQKIIDIGTGDMAKGIYDTNNDGKVNAADSADKFGGQFPEFYATAESDKTKLPLTGGTMAGPAVGMTAPVDTAVQFRNMVVYPAGTDLATVTVPAGTIICILK